MLYVFHLLLLTNVLNYIIKIIHVVECVNSLNDVSGGNSSREVIAERQT